MKTLLKIRPLLVGLSLFSLAWMIVRQVHPISEMFGFTVSGGVNYDHVLFPALLVLASVALLSQRLWSVVAAAALSGVVLANVLFRDFWLLARAAEVPRFSYRHFSLWWPNLSEGQLFQIILAGFLLCCSVFSIIRLIPRRKESNDV